jgi:hypothetical protein
MYEFSNFINNIYLFKFSDKITSEEIENFKTDFTNLVIEDKKFFFIIDLEKISNFKTKFFYSVVKSIDSNQELLKKNLIGSSIILSSTFKNILKVLINMKKKIAPNFISPNLSSSLNFFNNLNKTNTTI